MTAPVCTVKRQQKIDEDECQIDEISIDSHSSMVLSDMSMTLEDEIHDLQQQIDEYLPQLDYYRVGQQKLPFDDKEPIFLASGPTKVKNVSDLCNSCKTFRFMKDDQRIFCKFCGCNACKDCCQKKRNFPKAALGTDGRIPRGEICLLCDRKFLVRANFIGDKALFQKKSVKDRSMQMELKELELEIQEMNLVRNLRKWKHESLKKSEICVIKALKKENANLQEDMQRYKQQLTEKGKSATSDRFDREERLQAAIELKTKKFLQQQLDSQKFQKVSEVQNVSIHDNSDLEQRVAALENWKRSFVIETNHNLNKMKRETVVKSDDVRMRLQTQEEHNSKFKQMLQTQIEAQTAQLEKIDEMVKSLTSDGAQVEKVQFEALGAQIGILTDSTQKVSVEIDELGSKGQSLGEVMLSQKQLSKIDVENLVRKLADELIGLREVFDAQQADLDGLRVMVQNNVKKGPIAREEPKEVVAEIVKDVSKTGEAVKEVEQEKEEKAPDEAAQV